MSDILERLRDWPRMTPPLCKDAADEIERLRAALRPFALDVGAVSLSRALGHITREDLLRARDALTGGKE